MPDQPTTIAVSNQKGGVAKTTDAINLAGALNDFGERVLLWDADPQGYLTMGVGHDDAYTTDVPNQYSAMLSPSDVDISNLVLPHEEFDVIPSNIDMFQLEQELVSAMRGRERLTQLLDDVDGYDWIIIDCPPSLGHLTDNALLAAENLVIPAEAEDTSIRALEILMEQVDTLESNFDDVDINEQAILISNIDYPLDNEQREMLEWFDDVFGHYIPIFEFRSRVQVKRSFNEGVSIFAYEEECDQEDELRDLAQHLIDNRSDME